jgi:hypothetical protein
MDSDESKEGTIISWGLIIVIVLLICFFAMFTAWHYFHKSRKEPKSKDVDELESPRDAISIEQKSRPVVIGPKQDEVAGLKSDTDETTLSNKRPQAILQDPSVTKTAGTTPRTGLDGEEQV